jgi:cytochrome P450
VDGSESAPNCFDCFLLTRRVSLQQESLRKYSVVPVVARRTIQDLHMEGGYFIPKGSSLLINIQAVHLDPAIFPTPLTFDPSRFLPGAKIEPFTFLPFIAGPRNCLGQHLALLESKMVVGMLAQRYHFSLPVGKSVQMDDWSGDKDPRHRYMVPVIPKDELVVHVSRK